MSEKSYLIPARRDPRTGQMQWAVPGIVDDLLGAVTLPGEVYRGEIDPMSAEGHSRALDLAGLAAVGAIGAVGGGGMLASRSARIYNPPEKPPRPIEADYPRGVPVDDAGRITHDIEGRPLFAEHVVGRRLVDGGEEALAPAQFNAVSEGSIGSRPQAVAPGALPRGSVGVYRDRRGVDGPERSIGILRSLDQPSADRVTAHELGHVVDELSGRISTAGLNTELRHVYNTLNTGQERTRNLTGPQHVGYSGDAVPRELMTEAVRAYMADPNYLKTVAPKTAAAIRAAVNPNPRLNKTIQFNTAAPLVVGGGLGAAALAPTEAQGNSMANWWDAAPIVDPATMTSERTNAAAQARRRSAEPARTPPPPPGFVLDGAPARGSAPTPPAGFVMESGALPSSDRWWESSPVVDDPIVRQPSKGDSAALGALDTITFGMADEIGSGLDWAADRILPGGQSRSYEDLLALNRGLQQSAQDTNPGSYMTGQIGGGVVGGIGLARGGLSMAASAVQRGAGLGRVATASAVDGAILGGVHGAGSGEGIEGRAFTAGVGAASGGVLGLAAPVAVTAGGHVLRATTAPLLARLNPAPYARRALGQTIDRSGKSVDDIVDELVRARVDHQPMFTVADALGHAGGRKLSAVTRTPNDARQGVVDALNGRQGAQGERLANFLSEGFAAPDTAAQRTASLTAARSSAADTNYRGARSGAGAVDPSAAIQAADDFLQPGASALFSPQSGIADDSIEAAVRRARSYLTDGRSVVSDFDSAFRSKRELDAMIERAQPAVQRQLVPIRAALDDALATAAPGYAGARDTFRQQSRAIDAVETGRNAASNRTRADDNIPAFQSMTPEEQSAFRAGYVDPMIARVDAASVSPTTDKARMLRTEKTLAEFPSFAAPGQGELLGRRIQRERAMFETHAAALGGSRSADNLADMADLAQIDPGIVTSLAQGRIGPTVMAAVAKAINEVRGEPPAVTNRVAQALMETDPNRARAALSASSAADQARKARTARIIAALTASGAAGTGRLAAP